MRKHPVSLSRSGVYITSYRPVFYDPQIQDSGDMHDCDEAGTEFEKAIVKVDSFMERKPAFNYDNYNKTRRIKMRLSFKKKKVRVTLEEKQSLCHDD